MKKLMFVSLALLALGATALGTKNYNSGEQIEGEFAPKGMVAYAASYSSDPTSEPQYSTQNSKTFQYLNLGKTHDFYRGDSVKVGIIDSGINYDHEDFMVNSSTKVKGDSKYYSYQSSSWVYYKASQHGYSYIDDTLGHGTNVAATVAAALNSVGGIGLAPNVELYIYKVTNSSNKYEFGAIQLALQDAISLGIDIINMSFQSYEHDVTYNGKTMSASSGCSEILSHYYNGYQYVNFLKNCHDAGITLIGAAGNYNTSEPSYPGSNEYVINVGSLNETGTNKASFSNYGNTIDLVAPGYVYVADEGTNSSYTNTSGTSFSAPLVTAAAALYKQKYPSATPQQIESALYASCDPIDDSGSAYTNWAGNGSLNVAKLLGLSDGPTDIVVNNPEVVNDELSLEVGDTLNLDWTVYGKGSFDESVTFSTESGTNSVVSINSSGKITAIGEGEEIVYITSVEDPKVYAAIDVTVTQSAAPTPTVSSVTVTPSSVELDLSGTTSESLSATVNGDNNPSQVVTWSSSNPGVATVSATGVVTAVATGSATITAVSQQDTSKSGTCSVTVIDSGALPTSEDINDYNIGTTALTSSDISNGAKVVLGTTSSNLAYSVDGNWVYVGTIRDATYVFTIEGNSSGFKLKNGNYYIYCSGEKKVALSTSQSTTFVLNNNNYVGNSTVGYFCFNSTGLRPYKTTSSYSNFGFLYPLSIKSSLSSISVKTAPTKVIYEAGEYFNPAGLIITKTFSDASTQDLAYSNETLSQFTFSPNLQTALKTTDTSITITVSEKTTTQSITVTAPKILSSISVSGQKVSFAEGDAFSFGGAVTAHYTDGTTSNVTSQATFSGYNMFTVGNQTVDVSFGGKSTSYSITVSQGTLSSISVSGQTTEFIKNHAFVFDGSCRATFANGYQKIVTPTNVSTPDMSTAGQKEVTVSYTYNGKTKTTSYSITVAANRTVIEVQTTSINSTITWPSSATPTIEGDLTSVTCTTSGKTLYESSSMRLGTGSGGGTLNISSGSTITKVEVVAKYYSSSYSSSILKVNGTSVTPLTASYSTYTVNISPGKTSFTILTQNSSNRINIQSVKLYSETTTEVDITSTEDCVGLETFIDTYMHMDYVQNLGYCSDSEHHYYSTAKSAFNELNTHQRSLFTSNSAYQSEWDRLSTWASKNGDSLNNNNLLAARGDLNIFNINKNTNIVGIIIIISVISVSSIGAYFMLKRRKEIK